MMKPLATPDLMLDEGSQACSEAWLNLLTHA